LIESIADKKVLTVLNKSDLSTRFNPAKLPPELSNTAIISAKLGTGIEHLCDKILQFAAVESFDLNQPICFTIRQEHILKQLTNADSQNKTSAIITELLSGPPNV